MTNEFQVLLAIHDQLETVELASRQSLFWILVIVGVLCVFMYSLGRRR